MNESTYTSTRVPAGAPPAEYRATHLNAVDDAIHHLAQPLTALMFVIEMGRLQPTPELWKNSLDAAGDECRRAIAALDEVRAAVADLIVDGKEAG